MPLHYQYTNTQIIHKEENSSNTTMVTASYGSTDQDDTTSLLIQPQEQVAKVNQSVESTFLLVATSYLTSFIALIFKVILITIDLSVRIFLGATEEHEIMIAYIILHKSLFICQYFQINRSQSLPSDGSSLFLPSSRAPHPAPSPSTTIHPIV